MDNSTGQRKFLVFCHHYRDVIVAVVLILFFIGVLIGSQMTRLMVVSAVDARFWPNVIGVLGIILSLLLLVEKVRELKNTQTQEAVVRFKDLLSSGNKRAALTFLAIFAYILAMDYIGWPISTMIYLYAQISILSPVGKKHSRVRIAIATVVFTGIVFICFQYMLNLILPIGRLWSMLAMGG